MSDRDSVVLTYRESPSYRSSALNVVVLLLDLAARVLTAPGDYLAWVWRPQLFLSLAFWVLLSIFLGSFYKIRRLAKGGAVVAELLGGRRVESNPGDPGEQKLRHVVEEMSIASGTPVPEIYVLDHERGINTFAAGHTTSDIAIGVTRGCLKLLTRDELQAAIAHEFSHILNGDTRLNMRLMGVMHGILWPVIIGRVLIRGTNRPAEPGESILDGEASSATVLRLPLLPIGAALIGLGSLGLPFVRLAKSAICREREWLADAEAVQFTRNPAGLVGALKKIGGLARRGLLRSIEGHSKLPVIDLALPALRHLGTQRYEQFAQDVRELIEADRAIDLFEYTLQKILFRHLRPYYETLRPPEVVYTKLNPLLTECAILLSALAQLDQDDPVQARAAFRNGAMRLDLPADELQLLSRGACNLPHIDTALDRLAQAAPALKRAILLASAWTVATDERVENREAELLRAIADALGCPVPPPFVQAIKNERQTLVSNTE